MVIKVPVYVDIDTQKVPSELISELSVIISDVVTEHLQAKLPKSKTKIQFHDDTGEPTEIRKWSVVTRQEAIDRFK